MSRIPDISDATLDELAGRIKPLVQRDGKLWFIEPVDLRRVAYTWDPKTTSEALDIEPLGTIVTFHSFGAPIFFKPSVAEVLSQLPPQWEASAVAFWINETVDFTSRNVLDDCHVVPTTFFARAEGMHHE